MQSNHPAANLSDPYPAPWSDNLSDTAHSKDFPQRSVDNRRSGFLQYAEQ